MRTRVLVILAVAVVLVGAGLYIVRHNGQPQQIKLQVSGDPGAKVVGFVMSDGSRQKVASALPFEIAFRASRTEFAFAPLDTPSEAIVVRVQLDDGEWGHARSPEGVGGYLERTGIAGWGVNAGGIGGLTKMEVAQLTQ